MNAASLKNPGSRAALVLVVLTAFAVVGCGGGSTGSITGTVKYGGQPLHAGSITFLGQGGQNQATHADIVDGKYRIPSMQTGTAKVTVAAAPMPQQPGRLPNGTLPPPADPRQYPQIPAKYSRPDQSGLTYNVKSGSQTKGFDLTP